MPRSRLVSVPFAYSAVRADTASYVLESNGWIDDGDVVRLDNVDNSVGIGTSNPVEKLHVNGNIFISGKANIGANNTNVGSYAFVAGTNNSAMGAGSNISGGQSNTATQNYTTIGGGFGNGAGEYYSTVSGGEYNSAASAWSAIGGGCGNGISGNYGIISGGFDNYIAAEYGAINGGYDNEVLGGYSVIPGGHYNKIDCEHSAILGGLRNEIYYNYGTICGGDSNTIYNTYSTIGGGHKNWAGGPWNGAYATVPGGAYNRAEGNFTFAAGRKAIAYHHGSFVWADHTDSNFTTTAEKQFLIRANGGVGINTNSPNSDLHVEGSIAGRVVIESGDYTVSDNDHIILMSATSSANLYIPSASGRTGRIYIIKVIGFGGSVNIIPYGGELIDDQTSHTIGWKDSMYIISDGNNWWKIN